MVIAEMNLIIKFKLPKTVELILWLMSCVFCDSKFFSAKNTNATIVHRYHSYLINLILPFFDALIVSLSHWQYTRVYQIYQPKSHLLDEFHAENMLFLVVQLYT